LQLFEVVFQRML